ncbi:MAG: hypothetical protein JJE09_01215 [Bacteroidia bacterium]|nr:hypothetical protein [Bacteroidia bacterium]
MNSCIGIDYLDDPIIGESIEISPDPIAVVAGNTVQANFIFKDQYGIEKDVSPVWSTSPPDVATVDDKGVIIGRKSGQAFLIVYHNTSEWYLLK